MANTTVKGKFNVVAENGDVQTIYPKTTGDQVLIDRSSNASVIPNDVANLQHIVNKMGSLALKSKVETSDFTTGTMISSLDDLKSNTDTGKIADATVVKDIESRVDTLENSNLVTVGELNAGLATKPDTEINDSVTSTSLTWSSKKLSDQLTTLNSNAQLLNSRVNTIITHNNDTEGNSELIDIRTGADGTIYISAGVAVREQIGKIESDYNNLSQAVQQFAYTKSLDDYCKIAENKTIANVNGSYRIVDSGTNKVVYIAVAEIFSDGKILMFGSTNYSNNTFLFLDEDMNILGFSNRSSLSKSFFASLEYASDCVWAAVTYPKTVVPDITAVSRENFTANLNILPNEKGTNLLNGEFSHGYFSPSDVSWNASYRSTNIFEIPIGATISFNSAIQNSRYLILLDENLDYYNRRPIVQNISGQCLYTNQSGAKLFGYITSSIELYPTQTPDIAVVGTYSIDELNGMSAHELNDHLPQSLMPYDLSFALVSQNMAKTGYHGKTFSGLGDSLTAAGSGGIYLNLVKNALKLEKYKNCGNGGTRVSGNYETAFWQDSRVEQLDINSTVITIMGGTNDAPFITVSDSDFTFDNCDTNNFVGAYNVLLSKIFYKFLKRTSGYYPTVDYSNLTQVDTVDENFRVILITPPQRFDTLEKNLAVSTTGEHIKRISRMWGIPVIDAYGEMQMNAMTYTEGREDQVHFDSNFHKKLAEIMIGKLRLLNPID